MGNTQTVGGVGIFVLIGTIILFLVAMPSIEIAGYNNPEPKNTWNAQEFDLTIQVINDQFYRPTNVCFRIDNTAENVLAPIISANNFLAQINTEIECKECEVSDDKNWIDGQSDAKICREMAVKPNTKEFSLEVYSSWTTLRLPFSNTVVFSCDSLEETKYQIMFQCTR